MYHLANIIIQILFKYLVMIKIENNCEHHTCIG